MYRIICGLYLKHSPLPVRPGRKLARLRQQLELQMMLQCGRRDDLYSHYQLPIHLSFSPHYSLLFSRNLERHLGDSALGSGQMSVDSLWPIMLMSPERGVSRYQLTTTLCLLVQ